MDNVFDQLKNRGYVKQCSHEEELRELLGKEKITFYIGFDPTADSLHIGHFVMMMVMAHMQRAGHRPIALIGGGTTMIGDPTGKNDMRKIMSAETIAYNGEKFKKQMESLVDFSDGKALMLNNADWLLDLNYIDFLRDIGVHFSVNRMLQAESYKARLDKGLTFLEFNYMLMQSYDFLKLNEEYGAVLQCGGDDQWSNILSGADLIRRKESKSAFALTFALLTTVSGSKMGKTEKGALWLDPEKTSPFEMYQYFRNVEDEKVGEWLSMLTFLPIDEISALAALPGSEINEAKKRLAFEVTKIVHGEESAMEAAEATSSLFGGNKSSENIPSLEISLDEIDGDYRVSNIMVLAGFAKSKGDAKRLIEGGGVFIDDGKVEKFDSEVTIEQLKNSFIIQKGKKNFVKVSLKEN